MNRSLHAFAVLLVSLAGGMIAATWTSTLSIRKPVMHAKANRPATSSSLHCSCNPDCLIRMEQGCARDKTTGELYGCGLGLGKNGTDGKSVLSRTANSAAGSFAKVAVAIRNGIENWPWQELAAQSQWIENELAAIHARMPAHEEPVPEEKPQHERDYAAAELAAGTMYILTANRANDVFVITHANNAQVDRVFQYSAIG